MGWEGKGRGKGREGGEGREGERGSGTPRKNPGYGPEYYRYSEINTDMLGLYI